MDKNGTHAHIWAYVFLAITQPSLGQLAWNIFLGTQDTIIYRLVARNPSYDANFSFFKIFRATFGGKMCVATTRTPLVSHYLEIMFSKFSRVKKLKLYKLKLHANGDFQKIITLIREIFLYADVDILFVSTRSIIYQKWPQTPLWP